MGSSVKERKQDLRVATVQAGAMSSVTKSQVTGKVHDQARKQGSISRLQDWLEGYLKQLKPGLGTSWATGDPGWAAQGNYSSLAYQGP